LDGADRRPHVRKYKAVIGYFLLLLKVVIPARKNVTLRESWRRESSFDRSFFEKQLVIGHFLLLD
jgi:hypothetical protein